MKRWRFRQTQPLWSVFRIINESSLGTRRFRTGTKLLIHRPCTDTVSYSAVVLCTVIICVVDSHIDLSSTQHFPLIHCVACSLVRQVLSHPNRWCVATFTYFYLPNPQQWCNSIFEMLLAS
ncbi:hypothetical protein FOQG_09393 [Fusarium oxysporum f. sp. raphani 54005]|uniref:Uncharacterized protein n=4 Tax=Fusarium oxysporum TaxID=5507 RepID=X0C7C6_FUSOX|nr:hypothetical protein FOVG_06546 [Fusarium oxysporum f. sp. pisi HDV247]EXK87108.1 hypothetical protein FOQG_09393 [Fusarium oxysporum f. sp. raphani 54005]EXL74617.1 hypothetical protein FOPG_10356 [Fusarium oxysporum f. sp. conglutinans race 2 54008]EXM22630.1 hypothetical protein FOTG_09829 [Fusarium oxysporum f. sp. vasinfectum 25433]